MSSIGKIFVIVNLVLAVLVLGAAGALLKQRDIAKSDNEKLRTELTAQQAALEEANNQFAAREGALNRENQQLKADKDDVEVVKAQLEVNNKKLELDNQQLRDDVGQITAKVDALESSFNTTLQRGQELSDRNEALRTEAMEAKAAAATSDQARREAESKLADAEREATGLKDQLAAGQTEYHKVSNLLEVAKSAGFDATSVIAMPRIEAMVSEVDEKYGFVILDKGRKDLVERGFVFDIHRNGTYLGRVKVDDLYDQYATARIEVAAPGARMQRGDSASTYLN